MDDAELTMGREAWKPLVPIIASQLGMYTRPTFSDACSLLCGFELARGDHTLWLFNEWLLTRSPERPELAYPTLVLREALRNRAPRGLASLTEDEETRCIQTLSDLLDEFLDDDGFPTAWLAARSALHDLARATEMRTDWAAVIASHLDSDALVAAFGCLVIEFRQHDCTEQQNRLLEIAAGALRQGDWRGT